MESLTSISPNRKNRDRGDLVFGILRELYNTDGQIGITRLIYKVNTNYNIARDILDMLSRSGLIERKSKNERSEFRVTDKGLRFIEAYERINSVLGHKKR
ncbi:winged helix-turn-helix domain-containing protein [Thermoplasma sp. Kam2015]|uniref:winged helix-turn-helix domain-containing protein n=1 Tax=Thermoplasma sp. Kam2015 TaxID=2094122 RepID=UPI00137A952D|nr:winged helix-turn-helix domain-containing protein [Thermoplasma sp. Kam2015]